MANGEKKDFNVMLHKETDMPKVQIVMDEATVIQFMAGGEEQNRMNMERTRKNYHSLEEAVRNTFGNDATIVKSDRIHGGDINDAYLLSLSTGDAVFVKTNSRANVKLFETEAVGLKALRDTGKVSVPKSIGTGTDEGRDISFLLLEYIESAPRRRDYWEVFGHQLAQLHRTDCLYLIQPANENRDNSGDGMQGAKESAPAKPGARYGFPEDNFIGSNPQKNTPKMSWMEFYRECRLLPQIEMADGYFDEALRKKFIRLLDHLDSYMREPEFSSLLHGDLWSGNVLCGNDGRAWILDPAAYIGDFEADLAMTQLFGSFPAVFYDAYGEVNPIDQGYPERRDLYHLYQLLNHLNLFGRMYLGSVAGIVDRYVSI